MLKTGGAVTGVDGGSGVVAVDGVEGVVVVGGDVEVTALTKVVSEELVVP